ncbi:MAG: acyl carrier protein [Oscillospiraceae bacterium]|nr:acyl carrier protein [Oscillospiraceae bacterium]
MESREEVLTALISRVAAVFGKDEAEITEETRFKEDLAAKSTQITQITVYMEDLIDAEVPYMQFNRKATVGEAADYLFSLCG